MPEEDHLPVAEGYRLWAPWYDGDGNPLIAIEGPVLMAWYGDLVGRRALDLGCGTGRHTAALLDAGAEVVAADLTPAMLGRARSRLIGRKVGWIRLGLPGPLPFEDGRFDLVVLGLVAEHVADLDRTLAEVVRVLRPGGHCLLSALHPDRTGSGQTARFIDPVTGLRRPIATIHRSIAEYLAVAAGAGLSLVEERSLVVPASLGDRLPRAVPYVGQALGWAARWRRLTGATRGPITGDPGVGP